MIIDLSSFSISVVAGFFLAGLVLLMYGAQLFVKGASALAEKFRVPKFLVGSLVMSLATSSPELLVSVSAVQQGQVWIAIGNIFGSYITNIGLVLGLTGLIRPIVVSKSHLDRQIPFCVCALVLVVMACS